MPNGVTQEELDDMRYDMLQEDRADMAYENDMRDFDLFVESQLVKELAEAMELVKKLCNDYGHDINDIRDIL